MLETIRTHAFWDSVDQLLAHFFCNFGSDVTRSDPCTASGDNEIGAATGVEQRVFDLGIVVGDDGTAQDLKSGGVEPIGYAGPGEIFAFAVKGGVGDGDDDGGGHEIIVNCLVTLVYCRAADSGGIRTVPLLPCRDWLHRAGVGLP